MKRRKLTMRPEREPRVPPPGAVNVYELDGRVPMTTAAPLGLQHMLAMFVGNMAPILIITGIVGLSTGQTTMIVQAAFLISGLATLLQVFPLGRFGARLPMMMGSSSGFVPAMSVAAGYGYGAVLGAVAVGSIGESFLGFFVKPLRKFFPPVVTGSVIIAIGLSLMPVGVRMLAGGAGNDDFGSLANLGIGALVFGTIILFMTVGKGFVKHAAIVLGLTVGMVVAGFAGKLDFSEIGELPWLALPTFMPIPWTFHLGAILPIAIMFIVAAVETIGDIEAMTMGGLGRPATDRELSGGVLADAAGSFVAALFGVLPNTTTSQNVGMIAITKIVNRTVIAVAGLFLVLAGFVPRLSGLITAIPPSVLGGATTLAFAMIFVSGIRMVLKQRLDGRNGLILATALGLGMGLSTVPDALVSLPEVLRLAFAQNNGIAIAFILAVILNLVLPKDKRAKDDVEDPLAGPTAEAAADSQPALASAAGG